MVISLTPVLTGKFGNLKLPAEFVVLEKLFEDWAITSTPSTPTPFNNTLPLKSMEDVSRTKLAEAVCLGLILISVLLGINPSLAAIIV